MGARHLCHARAPLFFSPRLPKKGGRNHTKPVFHCRRVEKNDTVQCFVMSKIPPRNVRAKRKKATPYRDFSQNRGQGRHKAQKRLLYYARTRI